jgi:hypothetical protein
VAGPQDISATLDAIVTAGYLGLVTGRTQVSVRDLLEATRLQLRLGDSDPARDVGTWRAALINVLDISRRHMGPEMFWAFAADVRSALAPAVWDAGTSA